MSAYDDSDMKDNNRSCVLRVASQFGSLLLAGDIERMAEDHLLQTQPNRLTSDVLVVPHHGSKTSSTDAFVGTVKPAAAIFTVGYRNRFGHPKPEVLARYQQAGSEIYRSDQDGALMLDFSEAQGIAITRWRQRERRYWQDAS
jgi:competence protein ComEC